MTDKTALKWLGRVNFYLCQWFFFRITRKYDDDDNFIGWGILWGIVPTTGWTNNYRYVPGFRR